MSLTEIKITLQQKHNTWIGREGWLASLDHPLSFGIGLVLSASGNEQKETVSNGKREETKNKKLRR